MFAQHHAAHKMSIAFVAIVLLGFSEISHACDRNAAAEAMAVGDFEAVIGNLGDCNTDNLSGLEVGQLGWAIMMTADPDAVEEEIRAAWDLFLLGARLGNYESIEIIRDTLVEGDEDFGFVAQPEISECLGRLTRDVNMNDVIEPALVSECLMGLVWPE